MTCGPSELCVVSVRATGVGERERERERERAVRDGSLREGERAGAKFVVAIVRKTSSQVLYFVFCPSKVLVLICFFGIQRSGFKAASGFRGSRNPEPEKVVLEVRSVGLKKVIRFCCRLLVSSSSSSFLLLLCTYFTLILLDFFSNSWSGCFK